MYTNPPPQTPPQAWLDALKEGEADLAAGRVVPWPAVRAALEDILEALESGADEAEQERLLRVLDALGEDTHEDVPAAQPR